MANASLIEIIAVVIFTLAVLHTFTAGFVPKLAHKFPQHAGLWHLLSEVEAVFGFWALILLLLMICLKGLGSGVEYLETRNYTEPLFIFVIMVIAASRPILETVNASVSLLAKKLPISSTLSTYFLSLSLIPLLGSFITEPAAMTLAAILLSERYYKHQLSAPLMYATMGVLFVNVSIGGTLTNFAAPPVLMVASKWDWSTLYMFTHFGWRSALAVCVNAALLTLLFKKELLQKTLQPQTEESAPRAFSPNWVRGVHLFFLSAVVFFAHHSVVFLALFIFFLGFAHAYKEHQSPLILREAFMVGFFLAGLVTLGGLQQWWLQPTLKGLDPTPLYYLTTALTAVTDNAALTYLASLVEGVSDEFKYAVVSGAVTGGGLTVIANAPNPAGMALLKGFFKNANVNPLYLFLAATLPTCFAILAFRFV